MGLRAPGTSGSRAASTRAGFAVRLRVCPLSALFVGPLDLPLNVLAKVPSRIPARPPSLMKAGISGLLGDGISINGQATKVT